MYKPTQKTIESIEDVLKIYNKEITKARRKTAKSDWKFLPQHMKLEDFLEQVNNYQEMKKLRNQLKNPKFIPDLSKTGKPSVPQINRYNDLVKKENARIMELEFVERYEEGKPTGIERTKKRSNVYQITKPATDFTAKEIAMRINVLQERQTQKYKDDMNKMWKKNYRTALNNALPTISNKVPRILRKYGISDSEFMRWVEEEDNLNIEFVYGYDAEKESTYMLNLYQRLQAEGYVGKIPSKISSAYEL